METQTNKNQNTQEASKKSGMQILIAAAQEFCPEFTLESAEDIGYYMQLWYYFTDNPLCVWDRKKGIIVSGPYGVGKSISFRVMRKLFGNKMPFNITTCRKVVDEFTDSKNGGRAALRKYGNQSYQWATGREIDKTKPIHWYFDELGQENENNDFAAHYNNKANVMADIMLDRYDGFVESGMRTFATTNLGVKELRDKYGDRFIDKGREMFNLIFLTGKSKRK